MASDKLTIGGTDKLNGIRHFSLSRKSCTNATPMCRAYCYGAKGNMTRPNIKQAYERNYLLSQDENFVSMMNYELSENERFFRIHAVGDFYSLEYFSKWCDIAADEDNRHIIFMAYTRNTEIFKIPRPDNLRLIFSMDANADIKIAPVGARIAQVTDHKYKNVPHLTKVGVAKFCNSEDCLHCLECWKGDSNILFPQKYKLHNVPLEVKVIL